MKAGKKMKVPEKIQGVVISTNPDGSYVTQMTSEAAKINEIIDYLNTQATPKKLC